MAPLTGRQAEVLQAITVLTVQQGYPPTVRELCDHVGLSSTQTMQQHLNALERKGAITREPMKTRTVRVVRSAA
ncbi:MAG: LexA repressor [Anaerolineae bacterium]|nr:LexA repressor [Anaerolineae bacterium]